MQGSASADIQSWRRTSGTEKEVSGVELADRDRIIDWLDDGLRDGRRGRLEAEYPVSLQPATIDTHRAVYEGGMPLSHAMYRVVDVRAPEPIRIGMIGLVYSDPVARGRGLARQCIESCCDALEDLGAAAVLLWSDKQTFYERLDFHRFGHEQRWIFDAEICRAARQSLAERAGGSTLELDLPRSDDWSALEALYAEKRFRVDRKPGELETLATGPETSVVVARMNSRVVAYAALGRGDDFRGVVHEWAGSPEGVLACFEGLSAYSSRLIAHAGPEPGAIGASLERAGAGTASDDFALARILDQRVEIPPSLYLWGFDSI